MPFIIFLLAGVLMCSSRSLLWWRINMYSFIKMIGIARYKLNLHPTLAINAEVMKFKHFYRRLFRKYSWKHKHWFIYLVSSLLIEWGLWTKNCAKYKKKILLRFGKSVRKHPGLQKAWWGSYILQNAINLYSKLIRNECVTNCFQLQLPIGLY